MKHVSLRRLEIFRTVLKAGSITDAAAELNVTQPAVSRALSMLEDEVGFRLFHRARGRVQPSADAQVLATEVDRLFLQVKSLRESVQHVRHAQAGRIAVSAVPSLAGSFIGFAAGSFLEKHPKVGFEIFSRVSREVVDDVVHNHVDLGFIHGPTDEAGVDQWIVGESEIVCVMQRDHPLGGHDVIAPRDLVDRPLVFLDKLAPPSHLVREAFATSGYQPRVIVEANLSMAAKAVASAGTAVALIDPLTLLNEPLQLVLRPFRPRIPIRIFCVSSTRRPMSHAAQAMTREVLLMVQRYAATHPYIRARQHQHPDSGPATTETA